MPFGIHTSFFCSEFARYSFSIEINMHWMESSQPAHERAMVRVMKNLAGGYFQNILKSVFLTNIAKGIL